MKVRSLVCFGCLVALGLAHAAPAAASPSSHRGAFEPLASWYNAPVQYYDFTKSAEKRFGWRGWLACAVIGGVTGVVFTPLAGALVGTACRIVATPTPAYMTHYWGSGSGQYYYSSGGGGGGGDRGDVDPLSTTQSDGDWYYDSYYYDSATNEYYTEAYSYTSSPCTGCVDPEPL
jgi:hypothetical protein